MIEKSHQKAPACVAALINISPSHMGALDLQVRDFPKDEMLE
jgi:hypothetical protein